VGRPNPDGETPHDDIANEQRPVHVADVAVAALECLARPSTIRKEYDLGGAEAMTCMAGVTADEVAAAVLEAWRRRGA
jgi:uncharacterized protein YbjT (DUF2867 family)